MELRNLLMNVKNMITRKINLFFLISIVLLSNSCQPENDKQQDPSNDPPNTFNLISISDGINNLDLSGVTFTWEAATDPNGDTVTYEVYFGTDPNNIDILVETTANTSFMFSDRFNTCTKYYWKVIAKDNHGGKTESNNVFNFTTRDININNTAVANPSQFSKRFGHQIIVYDSKMWLIGGTTKDGVTSNYVPYNDVSYSIDGIEWEEVTNEATSNARFSKRYGHTSVTFKNKMWVIGGYDGQTKNDVWSSTDGWNWNLETANANFPKVTYHRCVVYKDKIWLFYDDEIWNSCDGINWAQINNEAPYLSRGKYTVTVFNNEMWLIGGYVGFEDFRNDIWSSTDGVIWGKVTHAAPFSPRFHHAVTVFDGKLFLIGGQVGQVTESENDVWWSKDGIIWTTPTINNSPFKKRALHTLTTYNDKIWIIAGDRAESFFSELGYNDVWTLD